MKPMTKEEWDKKQNMLQHVYDPETGRTRFSIVVILAVDDFNKTHG